MMKLSKRWMMLIVFILGAMIASGCAPKGTVTIYNDARDAFQRATIAGAKKCAPCRYGTAEAYLALADHEMKYYWRELQDLEDHAKIVLEKSIEALKLTPCEPPTPTPAPPPPPEAPKPAPPPPVPPKPVAPAPPKAVPVFENVYFNENKTNVDPIAAKTLDRDGMILKENPDIKVEIGGHTDSLGSEKANQKISEKRAESAKKYIMDKFNISGDRMMVKGYGSKKPIADDKTKEGRAKNRRVEFKVIP
jgi:outer membrane protein OmpA-like peptidoglycan-associated protein